MSATDETLSLSKVDSNGSNEPSKQRSKRGSSKRGGRPHAEGGDLQRQGKSRSEKAISGYGDGIERAICLGVRGIPPRSFPVQHRTGLAVKPFQRIAQTDSSVLLCDSEHEGPHVWPNGDIVGEE
jgi:hypothetical protein